MFLEYELRQRIEDLRTGPVAFAGSHPDGGASFVYPDIINNSIDFATCPSLERLRRPLVLSKLSIELPSDNPL